MEIILISSRARTRLLPNPRSGLVEEMKNNFCLPLLLVFVISLSACGSVQEETNPAAVIEAYEVAWNARDIEALLTLFTSDAVEINGRGTFYGAQEIRTLYEGITGQATIDCGNYYVIENKVNYDCLFVMASDGRLEGERYAAVIENGRIKVNVRTEKFTPQKEFRIDSTLP